MTDGTVIVYSKKRCPYCIRAKELLRRKGVAFEERDVEENPDFRREMMEKGGGRTVPQIFYGDRYLGDCEELHRLEAAGRLDGLLGREETRERREGKVMNEAAETVEKIIIIGSGPAGYTAAIYAARAEMAPVVIAGPSLGAAALPPGGQLMLTTDVENYPGFPEGIEGPDLMAKFREQAERFGTRVIDGTVESVDLKSEPKVLRAGEKEYRAHTVVIATGAAARWLGLESETRYRGKGVSACATCDGFFFKGEDVAVVGGGDTALEEALYLTNFAKSVTVIHRRDEFRASKIMQKRAFGNEKIRVLWDTVVEEVLGDDAKMTGLRLKNVKTGEFHEEPFAGLFVAIGHIPNTKLFRGQLSLDDHGYIVVPDPGRTATEIPGVFAAGDVRDAYYRQAVTAAGMGCMAAIEAERYLQEKEA
ncbi:MAG: thioredoxin-disulfide reductase [Candidatus Hydrogenedentota bacterium]|nr:MAG: thioredoxin-disulfide reductase [Candidatus Hydrogenedentota bacterium]